MIDCANAREACAQVLHGLGKAHRDLKPENVVRMPSDHMWYFIDLGSAEAIGAPGIVKRCMTNMCALQQNDLTSMFFLCLRCLK